MRIAFCRPPTLPLGLAYIAAMLEQSHRVAILDNYLENLSIEQLRKRIYLEKPEIVGITSDSFSFSSAVEIANAIKEVDKNIITVMGGPHSNVFPNAPLMHDSIDISVFGEGELTVVELWDKIKNGESLEDVQGIGWKDNNKIFINQPRELIKNLDDLPFPARHLFPIDRYERKMKQYLGNTEPIDWISSSRGCVFDCTFCDNREIFGSYRYRSPRNVVDEIEFLVSRDGIKGIYFRESLFTLNKKRVLGICSELKSRGLDIVWACDSRVDTIDKGMLLSMKDAGCRTVWFGIESGCQDVLNNIHKGITISQVKDTVKLSNECGLKVGGSFMIGLPCESVDQMHETINFACEIRPYLDFVWFTAYLGIPKSKLYLYSKENNLIDEDFGNGIFTIKTEEFDREGMEKLMRYAQIKFEMNPYRIFNLLINKVSEFEIRNVIKRFR
jgi:anaerobic magnesium-protoporphyrin IX monomethyl ester cyclase